MTETEPAAPWEVVGVGGWNDKAIKLLVTYGKAPKVSPRKTSPGNPGISQACSPLETHLLLSSHFFNHIYLGWGKKK